MSPENNVDEYAKLSTEWEAASVNFDKESKFSGLQHRLQKERAFLLSQKRRLNESVEAFRTVYNNEKTHFYERELLQEYDAMKEKHVQAAKQEVRAFIDSKNALFDNMLKTPPTDTQNRLLQVLVMRGATVTRREYNRLLPAFFGNYHAMKALQTIAETSGVRVDIPAQYDATVLMDSIGNAETYLNAACDQLGNTGKAFDLRYHAFYTVDESNPDFIQDPAYREIVNLFDAVPQLNSIGIVKESLTPTETARVNTYMESIEGMNETQVLQHVQKVITEHPEDIEIMKLSQYADYVKTVQDAATNATAQAAADALQAAGAETATGAA